MVKRTKKLTSKDTSNKPWVENYPVLHEWLKKIEARCEHQLPVGDPEDPVGYFEQWSVPVPTGGKYEDGRPIMSRRFFIIQVHARQMGWEVYTHNNSPKVAETLEDAAKRLGLI